MADPDKAVYWCNRSIELGPENFRANIAMQLLHLYQGDEAAAFGYARKAFAIGPFFWPALTLLRDHELRAGRYAEARTLYEKTHPELLDNDNPEVYDRNYRAAIDLALVLSKTGEQERADLLLNRGLQYVHTQPSYVP